MTRACRQQGRVRPVWLLWLLALLPLLLAGWQWQRGQQRQQQLARYESGLLLPPVSLLQQATQAMPHGQRVWLDVGHEGDEIRLANALLEGRSGVRILLPVALADGRWVVVDRGWLAAPAAYVRVPMPGRRLQGYWVARPRPYLLSGARVAARGEVESVDWTTLARQLPGGLLPGVVVLDSTLPPLRPWPVRPAFDPQRHYAYAVQWLLLGICLLVAAGVLQRRMRDGWAT